MFVPIPGGLYQGVKSYISGEYSHVSKLFYHVYVLPFTVLHPQNLVLSGVLLVQVG